MQDDEATQAAVRRAFSETADPSAHVPRPATEAVLESLLQWCRSDGIGSTVAALIAPPGFGKTHLLRVLEARLAETDGEATPLHRDRRQSACRALYLPYAALSLADLCHWVHGLLGLERPAKSSAATADEHALKALARLTDAGQRPFHLLIDDADSMPTTTLRSLAQGLGNEASPLRLVLALSDDSRSTRLLAAFDSLHPFELPYRSALDESETEAYLRARLGRVGLGVEVLDGLDPLTVARIRALSGGVPRRIHRVVGSLIEPERAALARALSGYPRTDAWLGRPMEEIV